MEYGVVYVNVKYIMWWAILVSDIKTSLTSKRSPKRYSHFHFLDSLYVYHPSTALQTLLNPHTKAHTPEEKILCWSVGAQLFSPQNQTILFSIMRSNLSEFRVIDTLQMWKPILGNLLILRYEVSQNFLVFSKLKISKIKRRSNI